MIAVLQVNKQNHSWSDLSLSSNLNMTSKSMPYLLYHSASPAKVSTFNLLRALKYPSGSSIKSQLKYIIYTHLFVLQKQRSV